MGRSANEFKKINASSFRLLFTKQKLSKISHGRYSSSHQENVEEMKKLKCLEVKKYQILPS